MSRRAGSTKSCRRNVLACEAIVARSLRLDAGRNRSPVVGEISGIDDVGTFEENDLGSRLGDRQMLDAAWDAEQFARSERDFVLAAVEAVVHANAAGNDHEDFVGFGVVMPHEWAIDLYEFNGEVIDESDGFGAPKRADLRKFVAQRNFR